MNELESICQASLQLSRDREPSWLATVVRVRGSSYRRPGARLLFTRDSIVTGSVSAGCIEAELVRSGPWHAEKHASLRTFEADAPDEDEARVQGSGCGGSVDVLIEPNVGACAEALEFIRRALTNQETVAVATVTRTGSKLATLGARSVCSRSESLSSGSALELENELGSLTRHLLHSARAKPCTVNRGTCELFLEVLEPSPSLFVFGAGADTVPVVTLATALGWDVTVISRHDRPSTRARFATLCRYVVESAQGAMRFLSTTGRPLALIMSHDYEADRDALGALLASRVCYLGVLGPLQRTQRLIYDLEVAGCRHTLGAMRRLNAPVGLAIGAETPCEIALAIIAEAQAALSGRSGHSLSEHRSVIHAEARPAPELRPLPLEAAE